MKAYHWPMWAKVLLTPVLFTVLLVLMLTLALIMVLVLALAGPFMGVAFAVETTKDELWAAPKRTTLDDLDDEDEV